MRSSPKVTSEEGPREKALTPILIFHRNMKGKVVGIVKPVQGAERTYV
jgi:hypothetical protein